MEFRPVREIAQLADLKRQYMERTTAPLDGMWLCGFVPHSKHYGVYLEDELAGYCCVNEDDYLLQYFVSPQNRERTSEILALLLREKDILSSPIKGAFVSTAEPDSFSLYLDQFPTFKVNGLMYQLDERAGSSNRTVDTDLPPLAPIDSARLAETVQFATAAVGAPAEWLTGYYTNLISRGELFGMWEKGRLIATGERRDFDEYQTDYADLGVIVAESARGRGLATNVLRLLVAMNEAKGLKSICSTEKANVAAQKAIARAGFFAGNRIIQFDR
jgi:RimJ/RimL family protein N-acetyltransferase